MKHSLSLTIMVLLAIWTNGQSFLMKGFEKLRFVGYVEDGLEFEDESRNIYLWNEESSLNFNFLDSGRLSFFPERFVGVVEVEGENRRYVETFGLPFKIIVTTSSRTYIHEVGFKAEGVTTDFRNLKVYFGRLSDNPNLHESQPMQMLDLESGELTTLPIKGVDPKVVGDYLFYANYPDPEQFDLVYDLYRVKIGEWQNPERIFEDNYMNGWKVSGDGGNLLVEVIETGYKPQKVIYNLDVKSYSPIPGEDDLPSAIFYSRKKKAFCFYDVGLVSNGSRRFQYIPIPDSFPYTPSWAMDFGNSFITHYLLEEASEEELLEFDKSELRLLRNSIFARKGWRFQSEDLQDFFGQFDWYKDQLTRVDSNDEVMLTNTDKYRSQLILRIEEKK